MPKRNQQHERIVDLDVLVEIHAFDLFVLLKVIGESIDDLVEKTELTAIAEDIVPAVLRTKRALLEVIDDRRRHGDKYKCH